MHDISLRFNEFYEHCPVISTVESSSATSDDDPDADTARVDHGRLALCIATARVMKKTFHLLGLETLLKV